jgi:hypothetical protein
MRRLLFLMGLCALAPLAHAQIFECVDEGGIKRFTNIVADAKGCRTLNILPAEAPPPPPPAPAATTPRPQPQGRSAVRGTPANFPQVDRATQQARDNDRRRILEQELGIEHKLLDDARRELAAEQASSRGEPQRQRLDSYQRRVRVHEDNIDNLRRELSRLR